MIQLVQDNRVIDDGVNDDGMLTLMQTRLGTVLSVPARRR